MSVDLAFREQPWGTADGRKVKLKDMDIGHLVNVLNWVEDHEGLYGDRIKSYLKQEAEYRRIFAFAEGLPYPMINNTGRWEVLDPKTGKGSIIPPSKEYIEAVKDNECYQRMSKAVQEKRKKLGVDK